MHWMASVEPQLKLPLHKHMLGGICRTKPRLHKNTLDGIRRTTAKATSTQAYARRPLRNSNWSHGIWGTVTKVTSVQAYAGWHPTTIKAASIQACLGWHLRNNSLSPIYTSIHEKVWGCHGLQVRTCLKNEWADRQIKYNYYKNSERLFFSFLLSYLASIPIFSCWLN